TSSSGPLESSPSPRTPRTGAPGYKSRHRGRPAIYRGDNEPYYDVLAERTRTQDSGIHRRSEFIKECNQRVVDFCKGADLLIADSQYTDQEYETKRGWGHSSISHVLNLSKDSGVKKLVLFHHEPTHDDKQLEGIERHARPRGAKLKGKLKVVGAGGGMVLVV